MFTVIGYEGNAQSFSANAETIDEALYVTEGYLKRNITPEGARVEIYRRGYGEPWLTLDKDAFTA
jgi:hypothetical protein